MPFWSIVCVGLRAAIQDQSSSLSSLVDTLFLSIIYFCKNPTGIAGFSETGLLPPLGACNNSEMDGWMDRKTEISILKPPLRFK